MAPKGKKGKKGTTVDLATFLQTTAAPQNQIAVNIQGGGWADEMDDDDSRTKQIFLPTAPRAAMEFNDDHVPFNAPFTAHIANLSYDTDEDQVQDAFERCRLKVQTVRLMKDEGGRLKGYGYIDFLDRSSLVDALQMQELDMNNRKVRIDLATGAGKERGGGGFGERRGFGDRGGERGGEADPDAGRSDAGDWRSGPPSASRDNDRGDRDRGRGGGERRGGGDSEFDRYVSERGNDRDRGFGGFRDRDERGGGRSGFSDRGGDRGGYSDRGGDREFNRRSPEPAKERPRLVLQPRSVKKEEGEAAPVAAAAAPAPEPVKREPRASIFGSAKPVDTTAKEKEIEEKLSKLDVKGEPERSGAYKPPGARGGGGEDRKDDKWSSLGRRDDRGGGSEYRRNDRGGYDRRDDRGGDRGYDRRDDRGVYRDDRRDDRGGGYDRDNRGGSERRDDRGSDRRDDREPERSNGERRPDDRDVEKKGSSERDEFSTVEGKKEPKPMKKYEEPKPEVVTAQNKFAFLQEEGDASKSSAEEDNE